MIPPALTPEEWEALRRPYAGHVLGDAIRNAVACWTYGLNDHRSLTALIALANAALPDTDPRKITWEAVDKLHEFASQGYCGGVWDEDMTSLADALAAYLPPREAKP